MRGMDMTQCRDGLDMTQYREGLDMTQCRRGVDMTQCRRGVDKTQCMYTCVLSYMLRAVITSDSRQRFFIKQTTNNFPHIPSKYQCQCEGQGSLRAVRLTLTPHCAALLCIDCKNSTEINLWSFYFINNNIIIIKSKCRKNLTLVPCCSPGTVWPHLSLGHSHTDVKGHNHHYH